MNDYTNESIALLPNVWNKQPTSNYYKLWSLFGNKLNELHNAINTINAWQSISIAQGKSLDMIGEQFNEFRGNANDDFYRFKIRSHIASFNKAQSVNDLLELIGQSFGMPLEGVSITPTNNPAEFTIDNLPTAFVTSDEIQQLIIERIKAMCGAGIKIVSINFVSTGSLGLNFGLGYSTHVSATGSIQTGGAN